jgi:GNAT superfamily N-acetyltransferase
VIVSGPVPVVDRGQLVEPTPGLILSFVAVCLRHPSGGDIPVTVTLLALKEQCPVGYLKWHTETEDDGTVLDVFVSDGHRRQGVATVLWQVAHEIAVERGWPLPKHSSERSIEGDAWARAVGGDLPDLSDGEFQPYEAVVTRRVAEE